MSKGTEILIRLNDQISKGLGNIGKNLEKTTAQLEKLEQQGKAFESLRKYALGFGVAIAATMGLATHKAIQFEAALAPVKTVLSGTANEVESASSRIGKQAIAWSSQYKDSAEEYLGASYNLLSAGLNEQQAIAGTNMALKLATATLGDAVTSSALLGTIYNNFGDKTKNANQEMMALSDTVAKTQQLFQIANLGQLNDGLKNAAGSALAFKVSFDQTSAVVGQLNTLGITGGEAGTTFKNMMSKLSEGSAKLGYEVARTADGGVDLVKTLKNISAIGADGDTINKVFGTEAGKGISLLTAKIGDLEKGLLNIQGASGATEEAFKKIFYTADYQAGIFKNNFNNVGIGIGKSFADALLGILLFINPILAGFNHLLQKHEWFGKVVGVLSVAISGLLIAFGSYVFWLKMGTVVTGFWNATLAFSKVVALGATKAFLAMNAAIIANPIGAIIAVAVGALTLLVMNIDKIVAVWNGWGESIQNSNGFMRGLWAVMDFFIGNTLRGIQWLVDGFKKFFGFLGQSKAGVAIEQPQLAKIADVEQKVTQKFVGAGSGSGTPSLHSDFISANAEHFFNKPKVSVTGIKDAIQQKTATPSSKIINVQNVTISDGVIENMGDFITQLQTAVAGA